MVERIIDREIMDIVNKYAQVIRSKENNKK